MDAKSVETRSDLLQYLSQSALEDYLEGDRIELRQKSTLLKTYIVERHREDEDRGLTWKGFVRVSRPSENLTLLQSRNGVTFFSERIDNRFCLLHTIAKTNKTDSLVSSLAKGVNSLTDRAWMPSSFLLSQRTGKLTGYKIASDTPSPSNNDSDEADADFEGLPEDIQLDDNSASEPTLGLSTFRNASSSRHFAEDDLSRVLSNNVYPHRMFLDWIETRSVYEGQNRINSTIYSNGKIISKTTSSEVHVDGARRLGVAYGDIVRGIESDYSIRWASHGSGVIRLGEGLLLSFHDYAIGDLEGFYQIVFSGLQPFALFGTPTRWNSNHIDVEAVDLHRGDRISFEMTNSWIRIYLPGGSCGNVICRFITNMQRYFSSSASLTSSSGIPIFTEAYT